MPYSNQGYGKMKNVKTMCTIHGLIFDRSDDWDRDVSNT